MKLTKEQTEELKKKQAELQKKAGDLMMAEGVKVAIQNGWAKVVPGTKDEVELTPAGEKRMEHFFKEWQTRLFITYLGGGLEFRLP